MSDDEEITVDQAIRALVAATANVVSYARDHHTLHALMANRKPIIDAVLELHEVVGLITKAQQGAA